MKLSSLLRKLAANGQHGHSLTPVHFYMSESYCSFYWDNHGVCPDHATWIRVSELSKRYRRFVNYCREILPEWKTVDTIYYADNSTEVVEQDKNGNRRQRMTVAPSGDACF